MGAKTKTVGGGGASGVANDFNSFLRQGLNNGQFGATGQTQGFGNTINQLLSGSNGQNLNTGSIQDALSRMSGAMGGFQAPQVGMPFGNVGPIGSNPYDYTQGLGTQVSAPQLSGFTPNSVSYSLGGGGGADLSPILGQVGSSPYLQSINPQLRQINNASQNLLRTNTDTSQSGVNSSAFGAISNLAQQQMNRDLGDINQRFNMSGGNKGSGNVQAQSLYMSQALPQLTNALNSVAMQQRGLGQQDVSLGLQAQNQGLQGLLGGVGAQTTARGQDLYNQLQSRGMDISSLGLASNQGLQQYQNLLGQRGQDISQAGQLNQNLLGQQSNMLGQRGQDLTTGLQNQQNLISQLGLLSQNQLGNRGLDINSILGQSGQNLQAQGMNQNAALQQQQLLQSLLGQYGNLGLGLGNLSLGGAELGQQGQLGALAQLFGSYNDANRIGTPQAQTVQQPSTFQNIMQGVSGLLNGFGSLGQAAAGFGGWGNMFGFGGGNSGSVSQVPYGAGAYPGMPIPGIQMMNQGGGNPNLSQLLPSITSLLSAAA